MDQRVLNLETVILNLATRIQVLEQSLSASNAKVETLNTFYGGSLQTLTERLLTSLEKASGTTQVP